MLIPAMRFLVRAKFSFGDDWQEMDAKVRTAAGCNSGFSGTSACQRDHGWVVDTFDESRALKLKLDAVPGVTVTIEEE